MIAVASSKGGAGKSGVLVSLSTAAIKVYHKPNAPAVYEALKQSLAGRLRRPNPPTGRTLEMKEANQPQADRATHTGDKDLAEVIRFHGHMCPGLAIGYRAAKIIMERLESMRAEDEELVAIVENDSCSVDAVQWITGCTFGKGNFIFQDHGKQVFTVALRPSGRALRVALNRREQRVGEPPHEDRDGRTAWLLSAPDEVMFHVEETHLTLPDVAQIRDSVVCDRCGEEAMVTRIVRDGPRALCIPCSKLSDK